MNNKKLVGEQRRQSILQWLKESTKPLTGGELADKANVSRQVIVQDISLLKAKQTPIIATSQGYLYLHQDEGEKGYQRVIACKHSPHQTKRELEIIVDQGVTVKDVFIEHPVYGDLKASIMVSNRFEVNQFIKKIDETGAPFLLELTGGIHLHTLEADTNEQLDMAYKELDREGFILHSL